MIAWIARIALIGCCSVGQMGSAQPGNLILERSGGAAIAFSYDETSVVGGYRLLRGNDADVKAVVIRRDRPLASPVPYGQWLGLESISSSDAESVAIILEELASKGARVLVVPVTRAADNELGIKSSRTWMDGDLAAECLRSIHDGALPARVQFEGSHVVVTCVVRSYEVALRVVRESGQLIVTEVSIGQGDSVPRRASPEGM